MGKSRHSFVGGHLSLDFVNTVGWRLSMSPQEFLETPRDLIHWTLQADLLERNAASAWKRAASRRKEEAGRLLARSIELRELCYRLFATVMKRTRPSQKDMGLLRKYLRDMSRQTEIHWNGKRYQWMRKYRPLDPEAILDPILRSASDILTSDLAQQVAQCQDDRGCGWLFLNRSRSRARRWCSMGDCGNRAKAKRHYYASLHR